MFYNFKKNKKAKLKMSLKTKDKIRILQLIQQSDTVSVESDHIKI